MKTVKDMYDKTKLSDIKKAELKAALKKQFPQYDESVKDRTEVINMENNVITGSGKNIKVHSRRFAPAIAAAALVVVAGGAFVHRMVMVRSYIEDEPNAPAAQTDGEGGENTEYSGYINDLDSDEACAAKEIFCAASAVLADIAETDDIAVFDDSLKITREMLLTTREESEEHKPGIITETEFIREIDDLLKSGNVGDVLDAAKYDFEITFRTDENGELAVDYAFIYADSAHDGFYSYPIFTEDEKSYSYGDGSVYIMQYNESDAKELWNEACEVFDKCERSGKTVSAQDVSLKDYNDENYSAFDNSDVVTPEIFAYELCTVNGSTDSVGWLVNQGGGINYRIEFETEDGVTAIGVKRATIATMDRGKMESFTYPPKEAVNNTSEEYPSDDAADTTSKDSEGYLVVPDVIGMKLEDAEMAISKLGVCYVVGEMDFEDGEDGVCFKVYPDVGSVIDKGTDLRLYFKKSQSEDTAESFPE